MLTSLRIQNFRSIRDATVKLGQVNLFIGPNNSGKSNFLKGISLLVEEIHAAHKDSEFPDSRFVSLLFRGSKYLQIPNNQDGRFIEFDVKNRINSGIISFNLKVGPDSSLDLNFVPQSVIKTSLSWPETPDVQEQRYLQEIVNCQFSSTVIYKIEPNTFQTSASVSNQTMVSPSGENMVGFIFFLSQNYKSIFRQLEEDLSRCVHDLVSVSTPADPNEPGKLKLRFFDQNDIGYWAEEVSEGVLYFLALLCIVHQPDPPKLLLLEEPEKGIHPRRIREVMDFIFELARMRDIQIILTSHSPYVVDYFADIPECISVFDRENGETVIHNAGDIISETNNNLKAEGKKPIRYSDSLGEHWVSGFLGGVPV